MVAREMLELAESARTPANEIQATLTDAQRSMGRLEGAIECSSALARSRTPALSDERGQRAVAGLARR